MHNETRRYLAEQLSSECAGETETSASVIVVHPVHINMVFVEMPIAVFDSLVAAGCVFVQLHCCFVPFSADSE
jgi:hypothetical protein